MLTGIIDGDSKANNTNNENSLSGETFSNNSETESEASIVYSQLSNLLSYFNKYQGLYKEGIDFLCDEVEVVVEFEDIVISEENKHMLEFIQDQLGKGTEHKQGSKEFEFVTNLMSSILSNMREQLEQDSGIDFASSSSLTPQDRTGSITPQNSFQKVTSVSQKIETMEKQVENLLAERAKNSLQKQVDILYEVGRLKSHGSTKQKNSLKKELYKTSKEKWHDQLDLKLYKNKDLELDRLKEDFNIKGVRHLLEENRSQCYWPNNHDKWGTLGGILRRANSTYEDKKILLRWEMKQVKIFLKSDDISKTDEQALKDILQDLQKEMKCTKRNKEHFNSNDAYIRCLKERLGIISTNSDLRKEFCCSQSVPAPAMDEVNAQQNMFTNPGTLSPVVS
ncbi:MAG: hypothetical protein QWI36_04095 [Wolbachia endosymbiont of Tyrophagus putrescentiae]|nr:hypothetical protein [Wolbachia endosymbiont of Tyrophagus putrescentiae]